MYDSVNCDYIIITSCRGIYMVTDKMTIEDLYFNVQNEWCEKATKG